MMAHNFGHRAVQAVKATESKESVVIEHFLVFSYLELVTSILRQLIFLHDAVKNVC